MTASEGAPPKDQVLVHKGKVFLRKLKALSESQEAKAANVAVKEIALSYGLKAVSRINTKGAVVYITSVMVQKSMLAAGLGTKEETKRCLEAIGNLSGDFALAAALGPETLGLGALLPLALAAVDGYDVGNQCFVGGKSGPTSHVLKHDLKSAMKTSKHGPI